MRTAYTRQRTGKALQASSCAGTTWWAAVKMYHVPWRMTRAEADSCPTF